MQRLLVICRHAESNDPFPLQPDFERELTKNGIQQARMTGQWMREHYQRIDTLLASPAPRASTTAKLLASKLYFDEQNIIYEPELYNARESTLANVLSKLPPEVTRILLVGHNPGITGLARTLTDQHIGYLEPAAAIAITMDLPSWQDIHLHSGKLMQQFSGS
ncbi:histidine phosphatase family protein [Pontibacter sp. JH31]|uniref:Histidine phosphatase family protein n=1 Tax=Pontibacter aquaedesilientis TaxID=2766980 RepID=A0ABR7XDD2_9BACT|nr:histidine phosphatase family protein [Pontibacter aquaedesilientis]MBD1396303.1 histidine phosphatase family protein [Pontibacter aquaedesilientis]